MQDNIAKNELLNALNVEDGSEKNTIDSISAGGTPLTIDANKNVNIPVAGNSVKGVVDVRAFFGNEVDAYGRLATVKASNQEIDEKTNNYKAIVPSNYTYAVSKTYLKGSEAPTTSTVAEFEGQLYLDTTNNNTYQCVAITTADNTTTYTWVKMIRATNLAENGSDEGGDAGVVKLQGIHYAGIAVNPTTKNMSIAETTNSDTFWNNRKSYGFAVKASNLDKYLKLALGSTSAEADNTTTWTDTNKTNACNKIGASSRGIARLV